MTNKNVLNLECASGNFQVVPWKLKDILIVFLISFVATLLSLSDYVLIFISLFLKQASSQKLVIYYMASIILLLTTIIWVKKIHRAKIETLGIRKGRWPLSLLIPVGIGVGIAYYFFTEAILGLRLNLGAVFAESTYISIMSKQIFRVILDSIVTPITEEVLDRGFIYGYLRKKFGVLFGLVIQSIVFAAPHLDVIISNPIPQIIHKFILGLILGVLYEISDSLYPSMICHGVLNFLV
jgi:membrane protease YdiL (CAAX protease family)